MRFYFDLVRDTLKELRAQGRQAQRRSDGGGLRADRHDSVAAALVPAERAADAGAGGAPDRRHRARRAAGSGRAEKEAPAGAPTEGGP